MLAQKPLVFLVMPRYNQMVDARAQRAFLSATKGECQISFGHPEIGGSPVESQTSVLPQAFNAPWVIALNLRKILPVSHWAMLHSDVEPQFGWLDLLVKEHRRLGCDVLSCVIPFQIPTGITSTAIGHTGWSPDTVDISEKPRRLTMREVYKLPRSFSIQEVRKSFPEVGPDSFLMVNTGCFLCDFSKPWVEKITFRFLNRNAKGPDGKWHTACRTEDFDFSLQAFHLGLSVFATTVVPLQHHGDCAYPNDQPWGLQETDTEYFAFHGDIDRTTTK